MPSLVMGSSIATCSALLGSSVVSHPTTLRISSARVSDCCNIGCHASARISALS
ncbi:hypothetical protein PF005_g28206 [Phytophthora fragariae]|uniref:Uncharacterized protein n=1 Tax=Phytophthora fragariae TaxID=53985 RepID=A0A6A3PVF1_9STRA|nr:hypothetical protein PF003_g11165 [Phytophthora fragariae]KAE9063866.1 hypothetical protein PF007_g29403 [Phytophthora fragariae]KAE9069601.1 hypothetical protein PF006_g29542 [Phytophthora fragariae]KAE9168858.1 hypothetical protein PF005_g28206 [Phytophthora fragariae]KAE9270719.1 hypothetical protein PF008_g30541 [Phytophthora fragariae]